MPHTQNSGQAPKRLFCSIPCSRPGMKRVSHRPMWLNVWALLRQPSLDSSDHWQRANIHLRLPPSASTRRLAVKPLSCKSPDRTQRRAMALSPATPRPRGIHSWTVFARPQSCALVGKSPRFGVGDNATYFLCDALSIIPRTARMIPTAGRLMNTAATQALP